MGMVDYFLWPHLERVSALKTRLNVDLMPTDRFPKLNAWASLMKSTPGVERTLMSDTDHIGFIESFSKGNAAANFDYGL